MELLNAKLNKVVPSRTHKVCVKDNEERIKETRKQWHENNKDQINHKKKQHKRQHSKIHQKILHKLICRNETQNEPFRDLVKQVEGQGDKQQKPHPKTASASSQRAQSVGCAALEPTSGR